jgi:hypothetical protein
MREDREDPLPLLTLEAFYDQEVVPHSTKAYLKITVIFEPATQEVLERHIGEHCSQTYLETAEATRMIIKGTIMEAITREYEPEVSAAVAFSFVQNPKLRKQFEEKQNSGMSVEEALKEMPPMTLDDRIVGPLLSLFKVYNDWDSGMWILKPQVEDLAPSGDESGHDGPHDTPHTASASSLADPTSTTIVSSQERTNGRQFLRQRQVGKPVNLNHEPDIV